MRRKRTPCTYDASKKCTMGPFLPQTHKSWMCQSRKSRAKSSRKIRPFLGVFISWKWKEQLIKFSRFFYLVPFILRLGLFLICSSLSSLDVLIKWYIKLFIKNCVGAPTIVYVIVCVWSTKAVVQLLETLYGLLGGRGFDITQYVNLNLDCTINLWLIWDLSWFFFLWHFVPRVGIWCYDCGNALNDLEGGWKRIFKNTNGKHINL